MVSFFALAATPEVTDPAKMAAVGLDLTAVTAGAAGEEEGGLTAATAADSDCDVVVLTDDVLTTKVLPPLPPLLTATVECVVTGGGADFNAVMVTPWETGVVALV